MKWTYLVLGYMIESCELVHAETYEVYEDAQKRLAELNAKGFENLKFQTVTSEMRWHKDVSKEEIL